MPDVLQSTVQPAPQISSTVQPAPQISSALAIGQGPAGPVGPAGPRGPSGAISLPAGVLLHGHRAVAAVDGMAVHADAATLAHGLAVLGIITAAAQVGDEVQPIASGPITHSGWSWAPGPVLLGLDGALVQSLPPGALYALPVGWGDGDALTVNIKSPIYIGA